MESLKDGSQTRSGIWKIAICARYCHVNRKETIRGAVCRTGERAIVHSQQEYKEALGLAEKYGLRCLDHQFRLGWR